MHQLTLKTARNQNDELPQKCGVLLCGKKQFYDKSMYRARSNKR